MLRILRNAAYCCLMPSTPHRKINGASVRVIREALGIRHRDLVTRVGFTAGTLTHIERGARQVSAETQRKIADALGVPLEAITYPALAAAA